MTVPTFDPGDKLFFQRTFTKATGQTGIPVNVTVVLTVIDPSGATTTPAVTTNVVAGVATSTASTTIGAVNTQSGMWYARWVCSVDIIAVEEEAFFVRTSEVL
jgi:hypothetical protein